MRTGKDTDPDLYLWLMDPEPDPGGQKNIRILNAVKNFLLWSIWSQYLLFCAKLSLSMLDIGG
jgi:hypothetical protein